MRNATQLKANKLAAVHDGALSILLTLQGKDLYYKGLEQVWNRFGTGLEQVWNRF
jgi:hypothetical protein